MAPPQMRLSQSLQYDRFLYAGRVDGALHRCAIPYFARAEVVSRLLAFLPQGGAAGRIGLDDTSAQPGPMTFGIPVDVIIAVALAILFAYLRVPAGGS